MCPFSQYYFNNILLQLVGVSMKPVTPTIQTSTLILEEVRTSKTWTTPPIYRKYNRIWHQ